MKDLNQEYDPENDGWLAVQAFILALAITGFLIYEVYLYVNQ